MNIVDIINKKEAGLELSYEELKYIVDNYVDGNIEDYQMSSLLMAICINGMTFDETYNLTTLMLNSGETIDLSSIYGTVVDKHSTGGVGDKTSLVVLPLAASLGVKIAKMSGRGLGFTGGTIDKLESIKGFKTSLSNDEFIRQVNDINMALVSQSGNLVPADKKIYALRDVTGTTESIPLIASSIMSKKLAAGSSKIVLDVKVGKGAFINNIEDARKLAKTMVDIGNKYGKETIAVLSNMDYPLGNTIGNALEVREAIETLKGKGEKNFTNLCIIIASYMVSLGLDISIDEAVTRVKDSLYNGDGLRKFNEFVFYQGGNIDDISISPKVINIYSKNSGYITDIDTMKLAELVNDLGAGRKRKDDIIDPKVGIELIKHINDRVEENDLIMKVYTEREINEEEYLNLIKITSENIDKIKIVYEIIK